MAGERPKKDYDSRSIKVRGLIKDLLEMGVVPRIVEIDGLHVEVEKYAPPDAAVTAVPTKVPHQLAVTDPPRVPSRRQQAHDELRRRVREHQS